MARRYVWNERQWYSSWTLTDLSRDLWLGAVSMFVPARLGTLGNGSHDAGMERGGCRNRTYGIGLASLVDCCSRDVRIVVDRGFVERMASPHRTTT